MKLHFLFSAQWSMFIQETVLGKYEFYFLSYPFYFFPSSYNFWLINSLWCCLVSCDTRPAKQGQMGLRHFHARLTIWMLWLLFVDGALCVSHNVQISRGGISHKLKFFYFLFYNYPTNLIGPQHLDIPINFGFPSFCNWRQ